MLRCIPVSRPAGHGQQFLCSDREGKLILSQPNQSFTILAGQPAHMSKTPYVVCGDTPAQAWKHWYNLAHPAMPANFTDLTGSVPGDCVCIIEDANTFLPSLLADGWKLWLHDAGQNAAVLFRAEACFSCTCWPSRQAEHKKACSADCLNSDF
ncbi:MAG: hypothetical protein JST84_05120 [Acidobacteria bacterium]|nr:hypothetical protein [Acidobacteriota bacterium]